METSVVEIILSLVLSAYSSEYLYVNAQMKSENYPLKDILF